MYRYSQLGQVGMRVTADKTQICMLTYRFRKDCSESGVHPGIIAGIYGSKDHGAYSIALSGQYNDDDDLGETL